MDNMKQIFIVCRYTSDGIYTIATEDSRAFVDANRALDYADYLNRKDLINCYKLVILDFDSRLLRATSELVRHTIKK